MSVGRKTVLDWIFIVKLLVHLQTIYSRFGENHALSVTLEDLSSLKQANCDETGPKPNIN